MLMSGISAMGAVQEWWEKLGICPRVKFKKERMNLAECYGVLRCATKCGPWKNSRCLHFIGNSGMQRRPLFPVVPEFGLKLPVLNVQVSGLTPQCLILNVP